MENVDVITDVKVCEDEREMTKEDQIAQLNSQLQSMTEQTDLKLKNAYDRLLADLTVYQEKWKTVTGYVHALETLRSIHTSESYAIEEAEVKSICKMVVKTVNIVISKIKKYETVDDFCDEAKDILVDDSVYCRDFIYNNEMYEPRDVAVELLAIEFCQQFGPIIEDIADFRDEACDQMAKVQDMINELNFSIEE